jgi:hypothetical protein
MRLGKRKILGLSLTVAGSDDWVWVPAQAYIAAPPLTARRLDVSWCRSPWAGATTIIAVAGSPS